MIKHLSCRGCALARNAKSISSGSKTCALGYDIQWKKSAINKVIYSTPKEPCPRPRTYLSAQIAMNHKRKGMQKNEPTVRSNQE